VRRSLTNKWLGRPRR